MPSMVDREAAAIVYDEASKQLIGNISLSNDQLNYPQRALTPGTWLGANITNTGNTSGEWYLDTEFAIWQVNFTAYVIKDGNVSIVMKQNWASSRIQDRVPPERIVTSLPIELKSGQSAQLWIEVGETWSTAHFVRLVSPSRLYSSRDGRTMLIAGTTGIGFTLVAMLFVFTLLLRFKPALFFAIFLAANLSLNLSIEGYAFYHFYPNFPQLNVWIILGLRVAIGLSYLQFIRTFLKSPEQYPVLDKIIRWFVIAILIILVWNLISLSQLAQLFILIAVVFFTGLVIYSAYLAVRDRVVGGTLFALATAILMLASAQFILATTGMLGIGRRASNDIALFLQLIHATVFTAAVVSQAFGMRRERDLALKSELDTSRKNLEIAHSLVVAKRARDEARQFAERNRRKLATASHDLRQPLTSLKLALESLEEDTPDLKPKISASLDYLDAILGSTLSASNQDELDDHHGATPTAEAISLSVIFDNLERMFASDAESKSLDLIFEPTKLMVHAEVISLIRVLSNLVSNAIKYTNSGRVRVSSKYEDEHVSLSVHDTGEGMDEQTVLRVMQEYERASTEAGGEGLGLSIVSQLVQKHDWTFTTHSVPREGSIFTIGNIPILETD